MGSVLVVDRDVEVRDVVVRILEPVGYQVRIADSGALGLTLFRRTPLDVVITEIMMPEMDGIEFMRTLRSEFPAVPILAISGGGGVGHGNYKPEALSTRAYLAAAEQAGADWVLAKPLVEADLIEAVNHLSHLHS